MAIDFEALNQQDVEDGVVDLFGGLDASDIADDPFDVPDDTYEVACTSAKIAKTNNGKLGLTILWKITDAGNASIIGRSVSEWFKVGAFENKPGTEEYDKEVTGRSFLKRRLTSMGVPESRMGASFDPDDLVGIEGVMRTKKKANKDGQENVTVVFFKLTDSH